MAKKKRYTIADVADPNPVEDSQLPKKKRYTIADVADPNPVEDAITEPPKPSFFQNLIRGGPSYAMQPMANAVAKNMVENPEEVIPNFMNTAGSFVSMVGKTNPMTAIPAAGLAGVVGAGAEGFRQAGRSIMGKSPVEGKEGMVEQFKSMGKEGAKQAGLETAGRLVGGTKVLLNSGEREALSKAVPFKKIKDFITKPRGEGGTYGVIPGIVGAGKLGYKKYVDFITKKRGAGEAVLKNPEITKEGFYTAEKMEELIDDISTTAAENKDLAGKQVMEMGEALTGTKAPAKQIYDIADDLAKDGRIGQKGLKIGGHGEEKDIKEILQEFKEDFLEDYIVGGIHSGKAPMQDVGAGKVVKLRQRLDSAIDYAEENKSPAAAFLIKARDRVDKYIGEWFPEIKDVDAKYRQARMAATNVKKTYGITPGRKSADYNANEIELIANKVRNVNRKDLATRANMERLDESLGGGLLDRSKEMAATSPAAPGDDPVFERYTSPSMAKFLAGLGVGGGGVGYALTQNPAYLAIPGLAAAVTSPRGVGAVSRVGIPLAKEAVKLAPGAPVVARSIFGKKKKNAE